MQVIEHTTPAPRPGLSLWFGTALIVAGVAVNLFSARRHVQLIRTLDAGQPARPHATALAVVTAIFLALVGLAMAIYLISVRHTANLHSEIVRSVVMGDASKGIIDKPSNHSVDQTVETLKNILQARNVKLFAVVDHSGEAEKAGMKMPPTKLLIFGSAKAGTPLMLAAPSVAIDLPLKILVWEDHQARVWLSYNSPEYFKQRHGLPEELLQNIAVVETLAARAAE